MGYDLGQQDAAKKRGHGVSALECAHDRSHAQQSVLLVHQPAHCAARVGRQITGARAERCDVCCYDEGHRLFLPVLAWGHWHADGEARLHDKWKAFHRSPQRHGVSHGSEGSYAEVVFGSVCSCSARQCVVDLQFRAQLSLDSVWVGALQGLHCADSNAAASGDSCYLVRSGALAFLFCRGTAAPGPWINLRVLAKGERDDIASNRLHLHCGHCNQVA
mmetsp:Transcript_10622/g.24984  ORF Transcript_10622/g.24984 Transcript_10622/m.24984 type:complete len:218 (-) Transcript_10622:610-1263(-)